MEVTTAATASLEDLDRAVAGEPQIADGHWDQVAIEDPQFVAQRLEVADRLPGMTGRVDECHQLPALEERDVTRADFA